MTNIINRPGMRKSIICFILIITMLVMQCLVPFLEAHAVAVAVGAVAAAAIAALLVMIGIKIMPTTTTSLDKIYSNLVRAINEGGETLYPNILDLLGTLATTGVKIGDKIKILGTKLSLIKTELLRAINVSGSITDATNYQGNNVILSDVEIQNKDKILTYEKTTSADWSTGNNPTFKIDDGQSDMINCRMSAFESSDNYFMIKYLKISRIDTLTKYTIELNSYGVGKYSGHVITDRRIDTISVNKQDFTKQLYYKFIMGNDTEQGKNFSATDGAYGLTSDRYVKIGIYEGDTLLLSTYIYVYLYNLGNTISPVQTAKDEQYKVSATTYSPDITKTKAKVIPGVSSAVIGLANEKTDGIDVTLPNTLNPGLESVCPDAKTQLDTLVPSIDYDDIQSHTWDDATDSELPDDVDGTIEEPNEGTGEVDLGDVQDLPEQQDLELPEIITKKFPFSIPWDVQRLITCLSATPQAPHFEIPFKIESIGFEYTVVIDLTDYETLAVICRWFTLMTVILGLILATRKLIGQ